MQNQENEHLEELYARGLAQFRAGEWAAAIETFLALQSRTNAFPEIDGLIEDARLKLEIERAETPEAAAPPKHHKYLRPRFLTAVPVLFIFGIVLIALRPSSAPPPAEQSAPTAVALSLPTPAPTNTPLPTSTPEPTSTPLPTSTPEPTSTPAPGLLTVRMAANQASNAIPNNLEIILDASGSMQAQIDGRRKIDIAHEALSGLIKELPDAANVALRAYGHRRGGDCGDIELVNPIGPLDRAALTNKVNAISPAQNGMTPIGASLQQVADDLKGTQGDVQIVLVSDGDETCNSDPVQIATQIHTANPKIKIDVIGFNVGPEAWRARLSGISQGGGGRYFNAADANQLVAALQQSVLTSYHVLSADGQLVYQGVLGSSATLPAGSYTIEIAGVKPITINTVQVGNRPVVVELHEQDGALTGTVVGQTSP
jgi:hypothetical protein